MATATFDPERKFVRVIEQHANGLVEFEFAVGEPELSAELVLPQLAAQLQGLLALFFDRHRGGLARHRDRGDGRRPAPAAEPSDWQWNLRDATHQRLR